MSGKAWMYETHTTALNGLPVIVKWSVRGEDRPATTDCPEEYREIEYLVCDGTGRHAKWIESKMGDDEHQALVQELYEEISDE